MKVLKKGMTHPQVVILREWLKEQGFDAGVPPFGAETFDATLESKVKMYQQARNLDRDGVVGNIETWPLLEREHLVYVAKQVKRPMETLPERPWYVLNLQGALDALCTGKVGYGTPTDSRSKMLKRPVERRLQADLFDEDEADIALKNHGTTHSFGGCSSLASRVFDGCILQDPTHRAFTNQTGVKPPKALRDPRFQGINDNIPDCMIDGDKTWQASGWKPTCRGYSTLFTHAGPFEWDEIHKYMIGTFFAFLHLQGGHVITAFYSDHDRGWWYTDPASGLLLPDDQTYILAADGWSGNVGQKTTLQLVYNRLKKRPVLSAFFCGSLENWSGRDPRMTVVFDGSK